MFQSKKTINNTKTFKIGYDIVQLCSLYGVPYDSGSYNAEFVKFL